MEFENFITKGLKLGFAGTVPAEQYDRMGYKIKIVHYSEMDDKDLIGSNYHDEWTDSRLGGGQELVHIITSKEEEWFTRLYAGGIIPDEELEKLGIKNKDVRVFLKAQINEQGEKTRLFTDCEPQSEGDFRYSYKITDRDPELELTSAKETIYYKDNLVFVHHFLLSPIK